MIEAALARPYSGYHKFIAQKAAALLHSLATNHGFIDGNKRTALLMTAVLLGRSGYKLRDEDESLLNREVEATVLAVVEHRMTFDELVIWFNDHIVKL